jgi:hypothetical protein
VKSLFITVLVLSGCSGKPNGTATIMETNKDSLKIILGTDWTSSTEKVYKNPMDEVLPSLSDLGIGDTSFFYKGVKLYPTVFFREPDKELSYAVLAKKKSKTDTLYTNIYGPMESISFYFEDYNFDRHPDLLIRCFGIYIDESLYIYDTLLGKFKEVENYSDHMQSTVLDSSLQLRYSYAATGCADASWESRLFRIVGRRIESYGSLQFEACDSTYYIFEQKGKRPVKKIKRFKNEEELDRFNYNKRTWIENFWRKKFRKES